MVSPGLAAATALASRQFETWTPIPPWIILTCLRNCMVRYLQMLPGATSIMCSASLQPRAAAPRVVSDRIHSEAPSHMRVGHSTAEQEQGRRLRRDERSGRGAAELCVDGVVFVA